MKIGLNVLEEAAVAHRPKAKDLVVAFFEEAVRQGATVREVEIAVGIVDSRLKRFPQETPIADCIKTIEQWDY